MATLHSATRRVAAYGTPRRAVATARREPVATTLLLTGATVSLVAIRRGALPTAHELASLAIGAGALVLLASVAPSVVTMGAGVLLLIAVLNQSGTVLGIADRAGHALDTLGG